MNYLDIYINYLTNEKRYSKHTVIAYLKDLIQFSKFLNINLNSSDCLKINKEDIRYWLINLFENQYTSKSVSRKLSTIKSFFKFLLREGYINYNPARLINNPKIEKELPQFIGEENINYLLDSINFGNDFESIRNKLIIEIFYATGIRLSELINLKLKNIDLKNKTIKVTGKRNKERIIPIYDDLVNKINEYINIRETLENITDYEYLFLTSKGKKIYSQLVYRIVKKYLTLITTLKKRSPHILRHTFATHLLNEGADLNAIKEILGHSNLSATQIYTHNTFEKLKKIYKQTHPRG